MSHSPKLSNSLRTSLVPFSPTVASMTVFVLRLCQKVYEGLLCVVQIHQPSPLHHQQTTERESLSYLLCVGSLVGIASKSMTRTIKNKNGGFVTHVTGWYMVETTMTNGSMIAFCLQLCIRILYSEYPWGQATLPSVLYGREGIPHICMYAIWTHQYNGQLWHVGGKKLVRAWARSDLTKVQLMDWIKSPQLDCSILTAIWDCGKCKAFGNTSTRQHPWELVDDYLPWSYVFKYKKAGTGSMTVEALQYNVYRSWNCDGGWHSNNEGEDEYPEITDFTQLPKNWPIHLMLVYYPHYYSPKEHYSGYRAQHRRHWKPNGLHGATAIWTNDNSCQQKKGHLWPSCTEQAPRWGCIQTRQSSTSISKQPWLHL